MKMAQVEDIEFHFLFYTHCSCFLVILESPNDTCYVYQSFGLLCRVLFHILFVSLDMGLAALLTRLFTSFPRQCQYDII